MAEAVPTTREFIATLRAVDQFVAPLQAFIAQLESSADLDDRLEDIRAKIAVAGPQLEALRKAAAEESAQLQAKRDESDAYCAARVREITAAKEAADKVIADRAANVARESKKLEDDAKAMIGQAKVDADKIVADANAKIAGMKGDHTLAEAALAEVTAKLNAAKAEWNEFTSRLSAIGGAPV